MGWQFSRLSSLRRTQIHPSPFLFRLPHKRPCDDVLCALPCLPFSAQLQQRARAKKLSATPWHRSCACLVGLKGSCWLLPRLSVPPPPTHLIKGTYLKTSASQRGETDPSRAASLRQSLPAEECYIFGFAVDRDPDSFKNKMDFEIRRDSLKCSLLLYSCCREQQEQLQHDWPLQNTLPCKPTPRSGGVRHRGHRGSVTARDFLQEFCRVAAGNSTLPCFTLP